MLFRRILLAALLAGFFSGALLGIIQEFTTTPIIIAAESFAAENTGNDAVASDGHTHNHDAGWMPHDGIERTLYSIAATIVIACAYALLLLCAMNLSGKANLRNGVLWGLAGYSIFFVAPSLGLSPEIPGTQAAALEGRQIWWLATICLTATGLSLLFFGQRWLKILAIPLLLIPHLSGAPHPENPGFTTTDANAVAALTALEHEFFIATGITLALFWLVLGIAAGYATEKYINRPATA